MQGEIDYYYYYCCICGVRMFGDQHAILANGRRVPNWPPWRTRCSSEDFKKIVFRNKEVWGTFVRGSKLKDLMLLYYNLK